MKFGVLSLELQEVTGMLVSGVVLHHGGVKARQARHASTNIVKKK
jgi:hypothetical protein